MFRAVFFELHVRGLHVPMDDTGLVPRFERFRDLPRDRKDLFDRDRAVLDPLGEGRLFHEL